MKVKFQFSSIIYPSWPIPKKEKKKQTRTTTDKKDKHTNKKQPQHALPIVELFRTFVDNVSTVTDMVYE